MRLFVAVTLGPALEATVADALHDLSRHAPRARWVPPANLHLTLSFLGDVDVPRAAEVERVLRPVGAAHAPLELSVQGGGGFGAPERPRVLWAGVGGDTAALGALQADVAGRLRPLGFEPEHREYVAHLTLARARQPRGDRELAGCIQALRDEHWGEARVERLVLFESLAGRYLARSTVSLA